MVVEDKTTLVIADDHPLIRQGLRTVLERSGRIDILAECSNGEEALSAIRTGRPAVAVLDVEMPLLDGFGVVGRVAREGIGTGLIILTMYREEHVFNKALDAGVRGYVLKENAIEEIAQAVHAVANGAYYVSPSISEYLIRRSGRSTAPATKGLDLLTPAERNILRRVGELQTSQQIADDLGISVKTVSNHRNNITDKLGLSGPHALLKFASENKNLL
jgi:DNA-binding NarL/FixJ family response regulator